MIRGVPYDAEVAYLESTGTQWIDTGVVANVNTRVVADLYTTQTGNKNWFGGDASNQSLRWTGFSFNSYSSTRIEYLFGDSGWKVVSANGVVGSIFSIDFSASAIKINGTTVGTPSFTDFGTQTNPIALFVRYGGSAYISGRVYSFQIYDNGVLVRDYISVRFTNELGQAEGAMYDRVTRRLFRNQGTGAFLYGTDVATPVMGLHVFQTPPLAALG